MAPLIPKPRQQLPKITIACMSKINLDQDRNQLLFSLEYLDKRKLRRLKLALHECLQLELQELGFLESSIYMGDLIYENMKILETDEIGLVVDIRNRPDYLTFLSHGLQKAEMARDKGNSKKECSELLKLAQYFGEQEKGVLWLTDKLYRTCIAVASQYLMDGGRIKAVCKYHYSVFIIEKFPGIESLEEPFHILTDVREASMGKGWLLYEYEPDQEEETDEPTAPNTTTVYEMASLQLHNILMMQAKHMRRINIAKAEQLARLAERRANDAQDITKSAQAIQEIGLCQLYMGSFNNAKKSFLRAVYIYAKNENIEGVCEANMQLAAVMQRMNDNKLAVALLTDMGNLAVQHNLRRQLGRALHFLGELYLRKENAALGTYHLSEAFSCFIGNEYRKIEPDKRDLLKDIADDIEEHSKPQSSEMYLEEAEQSRLMMAVSAGQEVMSSYFNIVKECAKCAVARYKVIEWKLSRANWWTDREHHNDLPCLCSVHNRTALDVMRLKLAEKYPAIELMLFNDEPMFSDTLLVQENLKRKQN